METYLAMMNNVLTYGLPKGDRTGTGTISLAGCAYRYEFHYNGGELYRLPLLTTKFVSLKVAFEELMWKLSGSTNIVDLVRQGNHIWTEWPFERWLASRGMQHHIPKWKDDTKSDYSDAWKGMKKEFEERLLENPNFAKHWGELGPTYGKQFRSQNGTFDQLVYVINELKRNPDSRRLIIDLWNPTETDKSLLPPCPCFYQFVCNNGRLSLNVYQRSADVFLGVPYNLAQDALFLIMVAKLTGNKPDAFNHFIGDAHIYANHRSQCEEQLSRMPIDSPLIRFTKEVDSILDYKFEDLELLGYFPQGRISAPVSI